jgi:hypothetical protein
MELKYALTLRNSSSKLKNKMKAVSSTIIGNKLRTPRHKILIPLFKTIYKLKKEEITPITSTKCTKYTI